MDADKTRVLAEQWREGDEAAAAELFRRFSERVWRLADRQLNRKLKPRVSPDTIMLDVIERVLRGIKDGQYAINHTGDLWRLLYRITLTKVLQKAEFHTQEKRDYRHEQSLPGNADAPCSGPDPAAHADRGSIVDFRIELQELLTNCTERTRRIVLMCLEGFTIDEIATKHQCSRWTVRRALDRFGERLKFRLGNSTSLP